MLMNPKMYIFKYMILLNKYIYIYIYLYIYNNELIMICY